jgi:hypothetical protein
MTRRRRNVGVLRHEIFQAAHDRVRFLMPNARHQEGFMDADKTGPVLGIGPMDMADVKIFARYEKSGGLAFEAAPNGRVELRVVTQNALCRVNLSGADAFAPAGESRFPPAALNLSGTNLALRFEAFTEGPSNEPGEMAINPDGSMLVLVSLAPMGQFGPTEYHMANLLTGATGAVDVGAAWVSRWTLYHKGADGALVILAQR